MDLVQNVEVELEVIVCPNLGFNSGFKGSKENRIFVRDLSEIDGLIRALGVPRTRISMEDRTTLLPEYNSPGSINGCRKDEKYGQQEDRSFRIGVGC